MLCGMFGKLPSRRDFVSYNMPRPFLDHWEEWLQAGVAASKHALGSRWQELFLTAPIWRFWLGSKVYGTAVSGALMPSVDGIGRYFPLTLCACEPAEQQLLPPPSGQLDAWHQTCEDFLLCMLDDHLDEEPAILLERVPFAPVAERFSLLPQAGRMLVWSGGDGGSLASAFRSLQIMNDEEMHGGRSYWWTQGGAAHPPQLLAMNGRADANLMASLLTGALG